MSETAIINGQQVPIQPGETILAPRPGYPLFDYLVLSLLTPAETFGTGVERVIEHVCEVGQ